MNLGLGVVVALNSKSRGVGWGPITLAWTDSASQSGPVMVIAMENWVSSCKLSLQTETAWLTGLAWLRPRGYCVSFIQILDGTIQLTKHYISTG